MATRISGLPPAAAVAVLLLATALPAAAGRVTLDLPGAALDIPVLSFAESRFFSVIRQRYDFSCGSAALATLLSYHHDHATDEQTVFQTMFALGDAERIRQQGFSLLDMKRFLETRGYRADGLRMTLNQLEQAGVPGIALTTVNGYRHFVVVKGVSPTRVLVGDPALGLVSWPRATFEVDWNGVLFVIHDGRRLLGERFNAEAAWRQQAAPPLRGAVDRGSLGDFLLSLPTT